MTTLFGWVGHAALALVMLMLALLSRRLGGVTHAPPYYIGMLFAAGLIGAGGGIRLTNALLRVNISRWEWWALIYHGLPALGLTIGIVFAWRYWSWLFAERD